MHRICTLCSLLLLSMGLSAQDGTPDPTFGTAGKAFIMPPGLNQSLSKTVVQPDGKTVIAGRATNCCGYDFSVARFKADGTPDETFDGDGFVVTEVVTGAYDIITTVAVQPDGKIIAGGYSNNDFALVRYNTDGSLDATFNGTGKLVTDLPGSSELYALALLGDGRILAAGASQPQSGQYDFTLVRYNPNGTLDLSFDGDGIVTTYAGALTNIIYSLAIQPDGRIVAAGSGNNGSSDDFTVVRYNSNGSVDASFNGTGKATVDFGANDVAYSIALQPDGKLVLGGVSNTGSTFHTAVARLLPSGLPDLTFDGDGKLGTVAGVSDQFYSVLVQPDGKILAGGTTYSASSSDFLVVRYNSNGTPDATFDGDGVLTLDMGADEAYATLAAWNNYLLAGGYSSNRLAVARLNNSSAGPVLPLQLVNFSALQSNGAVTLRWTIAQNSSLKAFDIEHSTDGKNFRWITSVRALDGIETYRLDFTSVGSGLRYYRLRMVLPDGKYAYSTQVAVVPGSGKQALVLLRNPVENMLYLQLRADDHSSLLLLDAAGRVLRKWQQFGQGTVSLNIPLTGAAGLYHLSFTNREGTWTRSFLKQ